MHADEAEPLEKRLDEAFAAEPAIQIADSAWVAVVCALVAASASVTSNEPVVPRVGESESGGKEGRPASAGDYYRSWDELSDTDRETVLARIDGGELPKTFQVGEHRFYVGRRLPYLSPTPITRRS
jgi:hypothetical protein